MANVWQAGIPGVVSIGYPPCESFKAHRGGELEQGFMWVRDTGRVRLMKGRGSLAEGEKQAQQASES